MWPLKTTARGAEFWWRWFWKSLWKHRGCFRHFSAILGSFGAILRPKMTWTTNVLKLSLETISIRILLLLRSIWVVKWLVCNKFEFGATNWSKMVPKWPQNDPKIAYNDLNRFKVTSETISIEIMLLLWSFWVVTWLVCDKFEFGDKNGPKLPRNDQKWPKIVRNGQKWL